MARISSSSTPVDRPGSVADAAVYVDGRRRPATSAAPAAALAEARQCGGFAWVHLHEPDTTVLRSLQEPFGLHELAVDDAVNAERQRPKIDFYDGELFGVFKTLRYVPHERMTSTTEVVQRTGDVLFFTGQQFVITVRHGEAGPVDAVRRRLEAQPELLALGPTAVLYAVADWIVDDYVTVVGATEDDIEDIESTVFSGARSRDIERIYQLKREVLELRRVVSPLVVPVRVLAQRAGASQDSSLRHYFNDVEDHLLRVHELVGRYDDLLTTVLQANMAQISMADNEDMRRISAWAAMLAAATTIAGIYGMNFKYMPELEWRYGYPAALALIAGVCLMLYRGFKRNGWL